jgi:hypothetical protein
LPVTAESVARSGISTTPEGKLGVTVEIAAMRGALPRPSLRAKATLDTTMAAPPSEVAQTSISRSGSATMAEAATSSAVNFLR